MTLQLGTRSSLSLRPITPRSNAGNEAGTLQRGQSLYDSTNSIRKGLLGVKILEPSLPLDNIRLPDMWIEVNFYFGGVEIAPSLRTRKSMYPKWKQWLRSNTPLNTLPKETRIYITLYGTDPNGQAVSLGWTVWPLFNWNGYLPMGKFQEELRRGGKLNPLIATAAPPEENKMVINVKMPSSPLPVAFPEGIRQRVARNYPTDINQIREDDRALLEKVFENDPLTALNKDEKKLVWKFRRYCLENSPQNLPKVMLSVQWRKPECLKDAHDLIQQWPLLKPHESLELLESSFPDNLVRAFAIQCLEKATDQELVRYLPQLVQVLKYENYHLGPLSTFLVRRALDNVLIVGVNLFWHLYTELHNPEIRMRYSLMIEAFLAGIVDYRSNLLVQVKMVKFFEETSKFLQGQNLAIRRKLLISKMKNLVDDLPPVFSSPIDPTITLRGINVEKCKIMDSNAAPLWIEFLTKEDPDVEDIFPVLVKCGDDPRQDILTLEMFSIMDHLWRSEGMELGMTIYKVVATGPTSGMVEIVRNSTTTAKIQKEFSGAAGAFSKKPLKTWLENNNTDRNCLAEAIDNFTRSCAASCVATHVIGIGDRHNDNVMVTKTGHLFHIDFGHFLGNVLKFGTFNRDAAPFVLTPEFVFVMGDETGKDYMRFREISSKAYVIVRKFYRIFLILFHMMLSTGIPQLRSVEDIEYLRAVFNLDCNEEAAEEKWKMLIDESLRTKTTQINNFIHNIAHPS
uniref:phosphatidylinositol 3-kinase n=1 Tax=Arcella intermedia TaxID=1963864 RepID=A0A6B2KYU8_9EUKA